jgi:hypothetical protein
MLDSLTVDSVMTVFNQGMQSGILTMVLPVSGVVSIISVIHLISYAVSKS